MRHLIAPIAISLSLLAGGAFAQDASVEGSWKDSYGTSFDMQLCGDGTELCATLTDIQGDSRTEENLQYVNQQVMKGEQVAPNEWEGTIILNGSENKGKVTQVSADEIQIEGCKGIFCSTLTFNRV